MRELLGDAITSLTVTRRHFVFRYRSPEHSLQFFRTSYGPVQKAFDALDTDGQERLTRELFDLMAQYNRSGDTNFIAPSEYIEVVATRR